MIPDQHPPHPGQYDYEPFGSGQPHHGVHATGKPTPPKTVTYAFYSMLAGASLTLIEMLYSFTQLPHARQVAADSDAAGRLTDHEHDIVVLVAYVFGTAVSLVSIGLWIWMAWMIRAGRSWARPTCSVLFGLNTLSLLITVIGTACTPPEIALTVLIWLVGLTALILLWTKQSGAYLRATQTHV
ncbi:hypothetical protein [Nocardia sp. NPDC056000]|uniref:hypothetical protein n=1 Tax=Nocardia sp. NPDC056000 TaxID=3345674 RepID=UPI0035D9A635